MNNKRQIKKRHKPARKEYGKSAHYWPELMLSFPVAAACTKVVLESSEKARAIYNEVVSLLGAGHLPDGRGLWSSKEGYIWEFSTVQVDDCVIFLTKNRE